ncbi:lytic transglycosylase domain-containing protein [candidate division KSB1 bacterium]|nr:lytic transglycosylase domain-containing protein [candidate division KSB1 bacterium]
MSILARRDRRGKTILLMFIILLASISTVSFSYKFYTSDETVFKMNQIEQTMRDIKASMKMDNIRLVNIQKIMGIMDKYNQEMEPGLKYEIAEEIYKMSMKYTNLDIDLICATITHESALSWDPEVVSHAGAMGLMQIMPTTGIFLSDYEGIQWTTPEDVLFNPIYNIRLGCRYLSSLIHAYEVDGGLAAYNGGEKRAAMWLRSNRQDDILWEETRGYVPAVLKLYKKFREQSGIL